MGAITTQIDGSFTQAPSPQAPGLNEAAGVSPADLAELIGSFNELTRRLQSTHETLTGEVTRLKAELRDANQQLRRARELAALGEMAAGIAHEVRNPLGSIRLFASALEDDLEDSPEQREMAQKIARCVRGLDAVVSDVLTFARELRLDLAAISAGELIDRSLASCADLLDRAGVEALSPGASGARLRLVCDAGLVGQALTNILRNAIEAMAAGDGLKRVEIGVSSGRMRGPDGRRRSMVSIRVRDHGPGVSDDVMERMFNPFFTTRSAGTGLGLAIVHRIVDAHCGRVTVRNDKEGGAVVELTLPSAPEQDEPTPVRRVGAHGGD